MEPLATTVMTESEYRAWWQLHRRTAVGEALSESERLVYEEGLQRLHSEKTLLGQGLAAEQLDNRLSVLEAEQGRLEKLVSDLSSQIELLRQQRRVSKAPSEINPL